jgi:hypothetical protein
MYSIILNKMFSEKKKIFETLFCSEVSVFTALSVVSKLAVVEGGGADGDEVADEGEPSVPITCPCDSVTYLIVKPRKRWLNSRLRPVLRGGAMVLKHYLIT